MYHDGNEKIIDLNSFRENKKLLSDSNNNFYLTINKLPLLEGRYTVSVGLYPEKGGQPFHVISEAVTLKVAGSSNNKGFVEVVYKWSK